MASVRLGGTANFPAVPGGDVGVGTIDETSPRHDSTVAANGDDDAARVTWRVHTEPDDDGWCTGTR